MKRNKLFVFIFLVGFAFLFSRACAEEDYIPIDSEVTVSMDLQDANLKDVLKILSIQSGMNFIASEGVQDRKITLYLDKVPLKEAMDKIFSANNLSYKLNKNSNVFIVLDWGKPQIETVTRIFFLKYATVSTSSLKNETYAGLNDSGSSDSTASNLSQEGGGTTNVSSSGGSSGSGGSGGKWKSEDESGIVYIVKKLLSDNGSLVEDYRTNSIVVTDVPSKMQVISQTIAALDVSIPQIMLEVEMLDVNKNAVDKIGLKFADNISAASAMFTGILQGSSISTLFPVQSFVGNKDAEKTVNPGLVDFSTPYNVYLDLVKQQADTKILARPRILTLNNETAEIRITTNEAIGTISLQEGQGTAAETTTSAERVETGISLRVTPQINTDTGEITMFIIPKVKNSTNSFLIGYKDPEERSTKTIVRIKDGDTVVIGGLINHDKSVTETKVPFLSDIPFIGKLFTHRYTDKNKERELLVFITPHIIKENNIELAQAKKISLPQREQSTSIGVSRQEIINSQLSTIAEK